MVSICRQDNAKELFSYLKALWPTLVSLGTKNPQKFLIILLWLTKYFRQYLSI